MFKIYYCNLSENLIMYFYVYLCVFNKTTFWRSECLNQACFTSGDVYTYIVIVDQIQSGH